MCTTSMHFHKRYFITQYPWDCPKYRILYRYLGWISIGGWSWIFFIPVWLIGWFIDVIHELLCHSNQGQYILRHTIYQYFWLGVQVTLHNHHMTHQQTHKINPNPYNNPPNPVTYQSADPDLDPSSSDSSFSESSDSPDDEYYKRIWRAKNDKNKRQSGARFDDPIKKCVKLTYKLLTTEYNQRS